mgnify:CR=1 FL=1
MLIRKKIPLGKASIEAVVLPLLSKNLIVLKGSKGYIMCGYLNLRAAEKFKEAAIKVTGVSTIDDTLKTTVHSCSSAAKRLGVYKGQPVKDALRLIA